MTFEPEPFVWNYCPICGHALTHHHDGEHDRPHCARCHRFYYRNPVPAACCIVTKEQRLLLVRRAVDPCKGQWCLPGGFVEVGETCEQAALRELREESGLDGSNPRLIGASTQPSSLNGAVVVMGYLVDVPDGLPCPGTDVTEARFFDEKDRPPLAFIAHRELMALAGDRH